MKPVATEVVDDLLTKIQVLEHRENRLFCEQRKQEINEQLAAGGLSKKQRKMLRSELSDLIGYMHEEHGISMHAGCAS